ncbi:hypothetical protein H696_04258 [Fonticula alba]|uniref:Complex III subunit 9 n=1 Tax=Fonticula alba TaxID=691883 RepID=A0A058Z3J6_FONAL|nr:hypothetical protein H696_04258 [Fonticula alba]KCV68840.1 hypothetical protein H696_04258 [Fonticula alba]|eukprot:XP_009496411.1 hypothetical protein H696_04258 [Fonticula alba]
MLANRIGNALYYGVFRRNSTFLLAVFASAWVFESVFDNATASFMNHYNKGRTLQEVLPSFVEQE